ncbi:MAG: hypothetical protein ABEJ73_03070 [Haloplanus sp.]
MPISYGEPRLRGSAGLRTPTLWHGPGGSEAGPIADGDPFAGAAVVRFPDVGPL